MLFRSAIDWGRFFTWTCLCLAALCLLIAQYGYFNFEQLAIDTRFRPLLEQACQQMGCRLPDIPDLQKLKITELVVRKDPKVSDALLVDAIIKNNADFAQPFPLLQLRFANAADEVMASRLLKPVEYLAGSAARLRRMPPNTPVHLSLAIVDPGKAAISYSLVPIL